MEGGIEQQRAIDAEVRATRRVVLATYLPRLRADPLVLADEMFLTLADRSLVRSAILVAATGAGADACGLRTYDPRSRTLRLARYRGLNRSFLDHFARIDAATPSACGEVLARGHPVLVDDVTRSPIFAGRPALAVLLATGSRAVHAYPLHDDRENLLAVLSLHFRTPGARDPYVDLARAAAHALTRADGTQPDMTPGLTMTRTARPGGVTLTLGGSLDARTVPDCVATLTAVTAGLPAGHDLIVELTHVGYVGVAGARALAGAAQACSRRGVPFHLVAGPGHDVRVVFDRIGVTSALSLLDEVPQPGSRPCPSPDRHGPG